MPDELSALLAPLLAPTLQRLLAPIKLSPLSRLPTSRLLTTALPNISSIELVSSSAFETDYAPLYTSLFHGGERERPNLIVERLRQDAQGKRAGSHRKVLGAAQFSVLLLDATEDAEDVVAVPYLQYIYVRSENRRQDLSELLHTLVLAVSLASSPNPTKAKVPFTLFETEPPTHGDDTAARKTALERTSIHARSGSKALMLRKPPVSSDGLPVYVSAHVQPGLEPDDPPLTLIWVIRPNPVHQGEALDVNKLGPVVLAAVYRSFRDEAFPEANIALAEEIAEKRRVMSEYCVMGLAEVTRGMYVGID
ncbi:uncharacterized protein CC84DRAFT_1257895 [Paraphaeosphaeria sporulosa]|uniref:Uncharacterized protein n=1 Tax=Paraphaeosphaeria sporulosa TaxID=1460663 RepID=A0A177CGW9_9PLEO|nr:uncharacterized protein CC84DRAFT_1257895 [Paraphaeosphaeria sporulosa]OAG06586.1 hypothetical protein CC84DRAFT_1257895 [Paraphaeosphaeria sporulosa]